MVDRRVGLRKKSRRRHVGLALVFKHPTAHYRCLLCLLLFEASTAYLEVRKRDEVIELASLLHKRGGDIPKANNFYQFVQADSLLSEKKNQISRSTVQHSTLTRYMCGKVMRLSKVDGTITTNKTIEISNSSPGSRIDLRGAPLSPTSWRRELFPSGCRTTSPGQTVPPFARRRSCSDPAITKTSRVPEEMQRSLGWIKKRSGSEELRLSLFRWASWRAVWTG